MNYGKQWRGDIRDQLPQVKQCDALPAPSLQPTPSRARMQAQYIEHFHNSLFLTSKGGKNQCPKHRE